MSDKTTDIKTQIESDIKENKVLLYMKGNKMAPMCGFSGQVIQALNECGVAYDTRDILLDEDLRQGIKDYSDWPTLPQLYVNGEFIGGCDIVMEMYESGELKELLASVVEKG